MNVTIRIAVLGLASMFAATAETQLVPAGSEFQANTYTTDSQSHPSVAVTPSGAFIAVWQSGGSGDSDDDGQSIQAQRFSASAMPIGSEFQVNSYTTYSQEDPVVAAGPGGEFVVVWAGDGIRGQRFGTDAVPVGSEFRVDSYTASLQPFPSVSIGPSGELVVVWTGDGIRGQRFGADGVPVGSEFQVSAYTTYTQLHPAVAVGPTGEFIVVWSTDEPGGSDDSGLSVKAQRFDPNGVALDSAFQVNAYTTQEQAFPAVAVGPTGEFVVVWSSSRSIGPDTSCSIQGRRFTEDGVPVGTEFQVNSYSTSSQAGPSVAIGPAGDFVVVWRSFGSTGTDSDYGGIQGQQFDADGLPAGSEFQINTYTTHGQRDAEVAASASGDFVVLWQSSGSSGTDQDLESIQGQRFTVREVGSSCSRPISSQMVRPRTVRPQLITTADALAILQASVGRFMCDACICDVDGSGAVAATDALIALQTAVGASTTLNCPACT